MILVHPQSQQILQHAECTQIIWDIIVLFQVLKIGNESIPNLEPILGTLKILHELWKYIDSSQVSAECAHCILLSKHRAITCLEQLHSIYQGHQLQLPDVLALSEDDIRTTKPIIEGSWAMDRVNRLTVVRIWRELCKVGDVAKLAKAVQEFWT